MCIRETVGIGKLEESFPDFIIFVEHDGIRFKALFIVKQFRFHSFVLLRPKNAGSLGGTLKLSILFHIVIVSDGDEDELGWLLFRVNCNFWQAHLTSPWRV